MSGSEEKTLPPSPHKLRQARRRGEFARSKDLITALVTAAGVTALILALPAYLDATASQVAEAGRSTSVPMAAALAALLPGLGWAALAMVGPLVLLMCTAAVLTGIVANGGLAVSAAPLLPKLDRITARLGIPLDFDAAAIDSIGVRIEVGKMVPKSSFGAIIGCMKAAGVIG